MIRLEPSMVLKFVEGLDSFVKFRIFSREALLHLLKDARVTDRRSYVNLVLETCVVQLPEGAKVRMEQGGENREHLRELLYDLCVGLNPDMDIRKVTLPVLEAKLEEAEIARVPELICKPEIRPNDALHLAEALRQRIVGQDQAVEGVAAAVARALAGIRDPERPIGTFMFLGQTGVGKTELAKALAEVLADGDRKALVRIDCSEYSLPHEYAKLIGAPPGYVGHEQGGYLSSVMSEANAAVVLFDEIEKADEKVHHLLLQIMDEGFVTDAKGVKVDFTDSLIIMTSNLGAGEADALQRRLGFGMLERKPIGQEERQQATQEALRKRFKPEFLNRIDETIVFKGLAREEAGQILGKLANQLSTRTLRQGFRLMLSERCSAWLLDQGFSSDFGARELRRCVQRLVETPLADALLSGKVIPRGKVVADFDGTAITFHSTPLRTRGRNARFVSRVRKTCKRSA